MQYSANITQGLLVHVYGQINLKQIPVGHFAYDLNVWDNYDDKKRFVIYTFEQLDINLVGEVHEANYLSIYYDSEKKKLRAKLLRNFKAEKEVIVDDNFNLEGTKISLIRYSEHKHLEKARDYIYGRYSKAYDKFNGRCGAQRCFCTIKGDKIERDDKYCFTKIFEQYIITDCCHRIIHTECLINVRHSCSGCFKVFRYKNVSLLDPYYSYKDPVRLDKGRICPDEELEKYTFDIRDKAKEDFEQELKNMSDYDFSIKWGIIDRIF